MPSNAPGASQTGVRPRYRILLAIARGSALLLWLFTLLNVVGAFRNPGFDANLWWIDIRFANLPLRSLLLGVTGVGLVSFGIWPGWAPCRG